jgi:hypothetical protein
MYLLYGTRRWNAGGHRGARVPGFSVPPAEEHTGCRCCTGLDCQEAVRAYGPCSGRVAASTSPPPQHRSWLCGAKQSPGRGNRVFARSNRKRENWTLVRLGRRPNAPTLLSVTACAPGERTKRTAGPWSRTASGAGTTEGNTTGPSARRHEAGGRSALVPHLRGTARALHSPHSADSRSRPPRPSRHIRDTGPDGVRECRVPLTGVRFPLCYLGGSRLESVGLSAGASLSSSESPP